MVGLIFSGGVRVGESQSRYLLQPLTALYFMKSRRLFSVLATPIMKVLDLKVGSYKMKKMV